MIYCSTVSKLEILTKANYSQQYTYPPIPGTHLHISTQQTGPEITERDARPSSIRTFVPSNNRNDSRRRQLNLCRRHCCSVPSCTRRANPLFPSKMPLKKSVDVLIKIVMILTVSWYTQLPIKINAAKRSPVPVPCCVSKRYYLRKKKRKPCCLAKPVTIFQPDYEAR